MGVCVFCDQSNHGGCSVKNDQGEFCEELSGFYEGYFCKELSG